MRDSLHITRDGVGLGSMSSADARALLHAGFLKPTDDFWRKGMEEWRPLAELYAAQPVESPAQSDVRERVRSMAGQAGGLARKLKQIVQTESASLTKARDRVLEDYLPRLHALVATQLKRAAVNVDAALNDEELMKKVFGAVFDCLPKPVTRFVAEDEFIRFCMKHKESLVRRDEASGKPEE